MRLSEWPAAIHQGKLTDGEKRLIFDLHRKSGDTVDCLAERFGVSTSTIRKIVRPRYGESESMALEYHKRDALFVRVKDGGK